MIRWVMRYKGSYVDSSGRFEIDAKWNAVCGNHWILLDKSASEQNKGLYVGKTLRDCKLKAETLR